MYTSPISTLLLFLECSLEVVLYPLACELSACGSYVWRLGNVLMITVTIINGFIHCSHSLEAPLTLLPATVRAAQCLCPYVPPRLGPPQLTHHRTAWQVWEGMCWRPLLRVRLKPVKQRGFEADYTYAKLHSKTGHLMSSPFSVPQVCLEIFGMIF